MIHFRSKGFFILSLFFFRVYYYLSAYYIYLQMKENFKLLFKYNFASDTLTNLCTDYLLLPSQTDIITSVNNGQAAGPSSFISQFKSTDASHHILLAVPRLHHKVKLSQSARLSQLPPRDRKSSLPRNKAFPIHTWLTPFRRFSWSLFISVMGRRFFLIMGFH